MPLSNIFGIAGSGMSAQSLRLNLIASNLANANSVTSSDGQPYRARHPVFGAIPSSFDDFFNAEQSQPGVSVLGIIESSAPAKRLYQPGHPMADEEGYVSTPNVNRIEEMANMISASRAYQSNAELVKTSKELLLRTLTLGQ